MPTVPDAPTAELTRFIQGPTLEARMQALHAIAGKRLESPQAAEVWLHLMRQLGGGQTPAAQMVAQHMASLVRQFLRLCPEHPKAGEMYALLMGRATAPPPPLVFMITSCLRYLDKARRLHADLAARGAVVCTVVGDPSLTEPEPRDGYAALPVSDAYEALTDKVLEGLTWLRATLGPVAVCKLDDDVQLTEQFNPQWLAAQAQQLHYAGNPIGPGCDRYWHLGKTSQPLPVFTRRYRGWYANGPMYLLGARAVEHLVREWVFYPGEFHGQIYEDRAVGETLLQAGIAVQELGFAQMGARMNTEQRYLEAVC